MCVCVCVFAFFCIIREMSDDPIRYFMAIAKSYIFKELFVLYLQLFKFPLKVGSFSIFF